MNFYAMALGLGAALGLWRVSRQGSGRGFDAGLLVLLAALLGARLGYAAAHWNYFSSRPGEILALNSGGLSGAGALAGWAGGLLLAALIQRVSVLWLADWLYPLLPPLAVAGLLGAWWAGAAYGAQLQPGVWWGIPAPDESGLVALRLPLQPAAALALLIFYALMERLLLLPRPAGWLFALAAAWYAAVDLAVSLLRADPQPQWRGLPVDTWGDLAALALSLGLLLALSLFGRRPKSTRSGAAESV